MKDFMSLCGFVAGKTYSAVNTKNPGEASEDPVIHHNRRLSKRGSVVLNKFFTESATQSGARPRCSFLLMMMGVLSIAVGCFVLVLQPYDLLFRMKLTFTEGGETYELWKKPPVELYLKVHLFNVTNKDAFLAGEEKLKVEEVGPYVYREDLEHSNITFNDNGTLSTIPLHPLRWVPELSEGRREDDILILPNIALLSIAQVMKDTSYFARMGINLVIRQTDSQPLVAMTAREFMFGYRSPLVTLGNKFMPSWIHFDKLGLIDRMYDFNGDYATVWTGETDIHKSGLLDTYNGAKSLPHWDGKCSNVADASDATKFPSLLTPNDTLTFYRKSVCRAMPMVRVSERVEVRGLSAYRYTFPNDTLDNGAVNPDNKCFCRNGHCLAPGLIDVTACYYGFPIAVSYPHFYKSDPSLVEAVDGSNPDKEKHETYFYIQPESGLPLDVAVRFQINMALDDISPISNVGPFKNMVLPMLWTEIRMSGLPDSLNDLFHLYLNVLPIAQTVAIYLIFIVGVIFLLASVFRAILRRDQVIKRSEEMGTNRHMNYLVAGQRGSIKSKEMEVFYSSLLVPPPSSEDKNLMEDEDKEKETKLHIFDHKDMV